MDTRGIRTSICTAVCLLLAAVAAAQDEAPSVPQPLTEELRSEIDALFQEIETERMDAARTLARIPQAREPLLDILNHRLVADRVNLLQHGTALAERVLEIRDSGYVIDEYVPSVIEVLQTHPDIFTAATTHAATLLVVPTVELAAAEQAAVEERFFGLLDEIDRTFELMGATFSQLEQLGSDAPEAEATFEQHLVDRAMNTSIYMDMAESEADGVRAGLRAMPNDPELSGKLSIVEARIQRVADVLQRVVTALEARDIDVSDYRQQLVLATREITSDNLRVGVIGGIISNWWDETLDVLSSEGPNFALRILVVAAILYVFYKLARVTRRVVSRGLEHSAAQLSRLLRDMIIATVGNFVLLLGALIALSQLGFSLGPVLAGLGIAGFVIGFALQDSLSNFASGMLILFTRPYDVGDIVELSGVTGKVEKMSLVNTTIHTFDNQRIIMPNTMIWGGVIKNVTSQDIRRVDMIFGISYSDDIAQTEAVISEILDNHELVLDDPEPIVRLHELGDSSVNFVVRPWARTEDYWTVYWDVTRAVKLRFDEEGISIPFPQRDIHVIGDSQSARIELEHEGEGENEPQSKAV